MKLKSILITLLPAALMVVLAGCGGGNQLSDSPTLLPLATYTPVMSAGTPTPVSTLTATTSPQTAATAQQKTEKTEQDEAFWNKPMWDGLPKCTTDSGLSHQAER